MSTAAAPPLKIDWQNRPLFWFTKFEHALEMGDHEEAAIAQRELERLGVRVETVAPWQRGGLDRAD